MASFVPQSSAFTPCQHACTICTQRHRCGALACKHGESAERYNTSLVDTYIELKVPELEDPVAVTWGGYRMCELCERTRREWFDRYIAPLGEVALEIRNMGRHNNFGARDCQNCKHDMRYEYKVEGGCEHFACAVCTSLGVFVLQVKADRP
jgi:hypothetical protein